MNYAEIARILEETLDDVLVSEENERLLDEIKAKIYNIGVKTMFKEAMYRLAKEERGR